MAKQSKKDEKIKNVIHGWICVQPPEFFDDGFSKKEMLAWIEKQKVQPQPQQEWSEEDTRLKNSCIAHIEDELEQIRNDKYGHSEIISDLKESCRERINWLKSIEARLNK